MTPAIEEVALIHLRATVEMALSAVVRTGKTNGHAGGRFGIGDRKTPGEAIVSFEVGEEPDRARAGRCLAFLNEKIGRNRANPDHATSFESRDEDASPIPQYGGAVVLGDIDIGFSGLPEHCDQAVDLIVGLETRQTSLEHALEIAQSTEDPGIFSAAVLIIKNDQGGTPRHWLREKPREDAAAATDETPAVEDDD